MRPALVRRGRAHAPSRAPPRGMRTANRNFDRLAGQHTRVPARRQASGSPETSRADSIACERGPVSHQRFERATLCVCPLAGRGQATLRREQLRLRCAPLELALGQNHCRARDLLTASDRGGVAWLAARAEECAACLFDGGFRVLRVVPSLDPTEPLLKVGCLRLRCGVLGIRETRKPP